MQSDQALNALGRLRDGGYLSTCVEFSVIQSTASALLVKPSIRRMGRGQRNRVGAVRVINFEQTLLRKVLQI